MHQLFHRVLQKCKLRLSLLLRLLDDVLESEDLGVKLLLRSLKRLLPRSKYSRDLQHLIIALFHFHFHLGKEECALLLDSFHLSLEQGLQSATGIIYLDNRVFILVLHS